MTTFELAPDSPGGGARSALRGFIEQTKIHEEAGAVIPWSLMRYGVYSCALVFVLGLLGLAASDTASISHGGFFMAFGAAAAGLASALHGLALPSILLALVGLGLDVYLMNAPTTGHWRLSIFAEVAYCGVLAVIALLFLAIFVFNLAIWIAIGCLILAVVGVFLAALAGG